MMKKYYTIKEVAAHTGINAHTLRYYDKEGLLTFVKRDHHGIRQFTEDDFEPLYTIVCLKKSGMPIKMIKDFMDLYNRGDETITARKNMFEAQREVIKKKIAELEETLAIIDYKCWYFNEAEKYGDTYFYQHIPEEARDPRIQTFLEKVKSFDLKD